MDRTWTLPCRTPGCTHPPAEHLATPELRLGQGDAVIWCPSCRQHEIVRPSRIRRLFGLRLSHSGG